MNCSTRPRHIRPLLAGISLSLLAGCAIPSYEWGSPPHTGALGTLTPNVSTGADILSAVGVPQGRGVADHQLGERPRTVWFYYFVTYVGAKFEGTYMLVFLDDDRYEGHLWFTSNLALEER